jgi:hypothetical protein
VRVTEEPGLNKEEVFGTLPSGNLDFAGWVWVAMGLTQFGVIQSAGHPNSPTVAQNCNLRQSFVEPIIAIFLFSFFFFV